MRPFCWTLSLGHSHANIGKKGNQPKFPLFRTRGTLRSTLGGTMWFSFYSGYTGWPHIRLGKCRILRTKSSTYHSLKESVECIARWFYVCTITRKRMMSTGQTLNATNTKQREAKKQWTQMKNTVMTGYPNHIDKNRVPLNIHESPPEADEKPLSISPVLPNLLSSNTSLPICTPQILTTYLLTFFPTSQIGHDLFGHVTPTKPWRVQD